MMGQNRVGSQPYILQFISKPMRYISARQPLLRPSLPPRPCILGQPHHLTCLLPSYIHIPMAARGKGVFYHIAALLTALQSSLSPLK